MRPRLRKQEGGTGSEGQDAPSPAPLGLPEPRRQPRSGTSHPRTAQGSFQRCTDAPFSLPVTSLPWHFRDSGLRTDKRSHWKRQPREAGYQRGRQSCSFAKDDSKARHSLSCNTHLFSRARMLKTSKKKKKQHRFKPWQGDQTLTPHLPRAVCPSQGGRSGEHPSAATNPPEIAC